MLKFIEYAGSRLLARVAARCTAALVIGSAVAALPSFPASAAFPNVTVIYLASGVRDTGQAEFVGIATLIHCTNWSSATQTIAFVVRSDTGNIVGNKSFAITPLQTFTGTTHNTAPYNEDGLLLPAGISVGQGSIWVGATTNQVTCSASVIDAAAAFPNGVDLHLVRFNPWPGAQE